MRGGKKENAEQGTLDQLLWNAKLTLSSTNIVCIKNIIQPGSTAVTLKAERKLILSSVEN